MIGQVIRAFFGKPLLAVTLAFGGGTLGFFWLLDLPRDVFPDLSAPVFNVIVQNAGMGAEELETGIVVPRALERAAGCRAAHGGVRARRGLPPFAAARG